MKFLLVTDLDNTLVGNDQATLLLNQKLLDLHPHFHLVYATGRSYASARQLQAEKDLLEPDFWVTGVGTEIYTGESINPDWQTRLAERWDRGAIAQITQTFPDLIPQSTEEQNPYKLSFTLHSNEATQILSALQDQLDQIGVAAQIVFSSNEDVDVLPRRGDKGQATTYLREQLGMAAERTIVCGDSGNDISLFEQCTLGAIVNNAQPELLEWHRQYGQARHYLARSAYAAGILEALHYFELL